MRIDGLESRLNRSVKLAIDSGEVASAEAAERLFRTYRLSIVVGPDVAESATLQAALLTMVNAGRRCFLGGVDVVACPKAPLLISWRRHRAIDQAVVALGGRLVTACAPDGPAVVLGDAAGTVVGAECRLRATFDGWCAGVSPLDDGLRLPEREECVVAGVAAGSIAVSEAFQFVRGRNAVAGRRATGMALWTPGVPLVWDGGHDPGPAIEWLPSRLWVVGLGHLGQALLWTLGLLPYADPGDVQFVLQDYDRASEANESTSLLTGPRQRGQMKTRAMARWCEQRGFRTTVIESRFGSHTSVGPGEPSVAFCGVDNALARAALDEVGFERVVEACLGQTLEEYLAFRIHSLDSRRPRARELWGNGDTLTPADLPVERPAYQALAAAGLDRCGLTTLAGRAVGASFVGAAVSALAVAELFRMVAGEPLHDVIDGTLRSPDHIRAVAARPADPTFNPGVSCAVPEGAFVR